MNPKADPIRAPVENSQAARPADAISSDIVLPPGWLSEKIPAMPRWPKVNRARTAQKNSQLFEYLEAAGAVAAVALLGWLVPINYRSLSQIYLLCVVALSLRVGRGPVFAAAVLSAVAWDYFAIPPQFTFRINDADDVIMFGIFIVVALVLGQLTAQIRTQGEILGVAGEREKLLTASDRLHRALFDSVSHELKTPLSALRAAVWGLRRGRGGDISALTDEIGEATDRLDRLVGNLLDQTRLESGTLAPRFDWCDVRDLMQETLRELDLRSAAHRITVEVAEDIPLLHVDAQLMQRALANLLLNAMHHTPAGSAISLRAGVDGNRIFISVADDGPGVSPELRAHLFKKFQRGAAAHAGGLGLGLSIVSGFVSAHGGEVLLADEPAHGATFIIYLPIIPMNRLQPNQRHAHRLPRV